MQVDQAEIIQQNPQSYNLTGAVDFSTVPGLLTQATGLFKAKKSSTTEKVSMDLSQVSRCNSAGLALMLELVKQARLNNVELQFKNVPDSLMSIARAYGVEEEIRDLT